MARQSFRIEGLKELADALGEMKLVAAKALMIRVGKRRLVPMRDSAKARVPVDKGDLKEGLIISTRQKSGRSGDSLDGERKWRKGKEAVEVYVGVANEKGLSHAIPQEVGSIHNPPAGYMRGAWDQEHASLLDGIADDLGDEIERTAARARRRAKG